MIFKDDILRQLGDHIQLIDGSFINGSNTVVDQIGGDECGQSKDSSIIVSIPVEASTAFSVCKYLKMYLRRICSCHAVSYRMVLTTSKFLQCMLSLMNLRGTKFMGEDTPDPSSINNLLRRKLLPVRYFPARQTKPTGIS